MTHSNFYRTGCFFLVILLSAYGQKITASEPAQQISADATVESLSPPKKPNIVLIQVDDFGYDDMGFHGNKLIDTPNIDNLAKGSVRFDQFYVSSLCAPTRAALLTGRNFMRTGVSGVHAGRDYIHLDESIFPQVLQSNDYATGMWGKWHSGKTNGYFPWDRGFDEAYYATLYNYFDNNGLLNGKEVHTKGSATTAITDFAIDFITRKREQALFAYIPYMAPHNPWRAPQASIDKYKAKGLSHAMSSLYGMIDNLDVNIGRLLDAIKQQGLWDNTIVVFISDNGPHTRSYRFGLNEEEWKLRNPNQRRGKKSENWENGIHSPFFVHWPVVYKAQSINTVVQIEDIFPTILEWAGIDVPVELKLDGQSLLKLLNKQQDQPRTVVSSWATPLAPQVEHNEQDKSGFYRVLTPNYKKHFLFENQRLAIRKGNYKYIINEQKGNAESKLNDAAELYNITVDPQEKINLVDEKPDISHELEHNLRDWFSGILSEPHALQMPVFQIGFAERKFSQIYAQSPSEHSVKLVNMDHYIGNWKEEGDWSEYRINVLTAGKYDIYLTSKILSPEQKTFSVTASNNTISAQLKGLPEAEIGTLIRNESAYWNNFDHFDSFKSEIKNQFLGDIKLDSGPGTLRLELERIESGGLLENTDQIIAIQLIRHTED
jgi:arylsulfatase A-like enzyme